MQWDFRLPEIPLFFIENNNLKVLDKSITFEYNIIRRGG